MNIVATKSSTEILSDVIREEDEELEEESESASELSEDDKVDELKKHLEGILDKLQKQEIQINQMRNIMSHSVSQ